MAGVTAAGLALLVTTAEAVIAAAVMIPEVLEIFQVLQATNYG